MKTRFHRLTIGLVLVALILPSAHVLAGPPRLPPFQEETSPPEPSIPTPADVINAVNNLRLQNGLNALIVHDVLMEVAASEGIIGHERPAA